MTTIERIVNAVKGLMGDNYEVYLKEIGKNNGLVCQTVTIHKQGSKVDLFIHIDSFLEKIESGEISVQEAAAEITGVYWERYNKEGFIDIKNYVSKEYILDRVVYQIVNKRKNAKRLKKMPYKEFLDLAVVYRVIWIEENSGAFTMAVTNDFCDAYSISREELDTAARGNTEKRGFCVYSMASLLKGLSGAPENMEKAPMWVLTNPAKFHGAVVMLYKDYLNSLADQQKSDLYILPSSIHEVIAVPVNVIQLDILKTMVCEINDTEVAADEVLSNNVYRYNRDNGELFLV